MLKRWNFLKTGFYEGIKIKVTTQVRVIGVRFKRSGRVEYFDPGDLDMAVGDRVVVQTESGPRGGQVAIAPHQVLYSGLQATQGPVLRKADLPEKPPP